MGTDEYDTRIQSIREGLERKLDELGVRSGGRVSYEQFVELIGRLENPNYEGDTRSFVDRLWSALNPNAEETVACDEVYNILMIFIGTTRFELKVTADLMGEFLQRLAPGRSNYM